MAALGPPYDLTSLAERLARLEAPPAPSDPSPRAAVAAILRDGGPGRDAEVLFIRRAERDADPWSGHMAFPGGRWEGADPHILATAIRETREEVGIDLGASGALLTRLADVPAVARGHRIGLVITPFVFALRGEVTLTFDATEVAEALWAPLGPLARGEQAGTVTYHHDGRDLELPCLRLGDHVVWGLTYWMLQMLFDALRAAE